MGLGKGLLIFAAAALAAIGVSIAVYTAYAFANFEEQTMPDFSDPPPQPRYLASDSIECKYAIDQHYSWAKSNYDSGTEEIAKLKEYYQGILNRQSEYEMELVNNESFADWTYTGWEDSWAATTEEMPQWSEEMMNQFGEGATPLRSVDRTEDAVATLFDWRARYGMEAEIAFRRQLDAPYYPPEAYEMCSAETRLYGDLLVEYLYYYCCDARPTNYTPMLENLDAWMDTTYSQ